MTERKQEVLFRFVKNAPNRIIFLYEPKNKDNKNPTTGVDILGEMCSVVKYKLSSLILKTVYNILIS